MQIKFKGEELTNQEVNEILKNFYLWKHSITRLEQRTNLVSRNNGKFDKYKTKGNIYQLIKHNKKLAYFNIDGTVNIAIDDFNYFVFKYIDERSKWLCYTFKEPSYNNVSIYDKRELALKGISRK